MADTSLIQLLQRCLHEVLNGSIPPSDLLIATLSKVCMESGVQKGTCIERTFLTCTSCQQTSHHPRRTLRPH